MGFTAFLVVQPTSRSLLQHTSFTSTNRLTRYPLSKCRAFPKHRSTRACIDAKHDPLPRITSKEDNIQKSTVIRSLRTILKILRVAIPVLLIMTRVSPALAQVGGISGAIARGWARLRVGQLAGFSSGLAAALLLVLASEIGDKTFFISMLMSMRYSKLPVVIGTMLALGPMTVISVGIGQIFHALPASFNTSIPFDDYAAVALLCWFGFRNIRDGLVTHTDEDEELSDAKEVVSKARTLPSKWRVVTETFTLVFVAEWGDKSMLATVALATAKSPLGVILGGITGHLVATIIAVLGGSFLSKYISERNVRLIGGALFLLFAALTLFAGY